MILNYLQTTKRILALSAFLFSTIISAQDIHFTFANAQNTNDGSNDFYEVDVMIQTINGTGDFKLGSGQLYFNYNTAAFGMSVSGSSVFEVTYPNAGGYICGQQLDLAPIDVYGSFGDNDNTTSRVSWNFAQTFSASAFAAVNVTDTPTQLAHIKIQYTNVLEDPMFTFEDGTAFDDQFFTACGSSAGGPFDTADCTNFAGSQLLNDTFDSNGGSTLSNDTVTALTGISVYPNPATDVVNIKSLNAQLTGIDVFNINGQQLVSKTNNLEVINVSNLNTGVYFVKLYTERSSKTIKLIKK